MSVSTSISERRCRCIPESMEERRRHLVASFLVHGRSEVQWKSVGVGVCLSELSAKASQGGVGDGTAGTCMHRRTPPQVFHVCLLKPPGHAT